MINHLKILLITVIISALNAIVHGQSDTIDSNLNVKVYKTSENQKRFRSSPLRQSLSDYDVLNYHINLVIDPENKKIGGMVRIT